MKFNVTIEGKHLLFLIVLAGIAVGINYAGAWANPITGVGHSADEVGPGTMTGPIGVDGSLDITNGMLTIDSAAAYIRSGLSGYGWFELGRRNALNLFYISRQGQDSPYDFVILGANGRIGIHENNPAAGLVVHESAGIRAYSGSGYVNITASSGNLDASGNITIVTQNADVLLRIGSAITNSVNVRGIQLDYYTSKQGIEWVTATTGSGYGFKLYSVNDQDLRLAKRTNTRTWTDVMTWYRDANVGIGTTTPKGKLDVAGGISIGSYAGVNAPPSSGVIISGDVGIGTNIPDWKLDVRGDRIQLTEDGTGHWIALRTDGAALDLSSSGADLYITPQNDGENILLAPFTTGSVGIGTADPGSYKLRVYGGPLQVDTSGESQFKSGNTYIHLRVFDGAGTSGYGSIGAYRSGEGWKNLILNAGGGNVGIGMTPGSSYRLDVDGYVRATGLCIGGVCSSSWPAFGAREAKAVDTDYVAPTDGFVLARGTGGHCGGAVFGYINGELISSGGSGYVDVGGGASFTMPVRNGETWRVSRIGCVYAANVKVYWMPLGS